jgi:predicted MarR family transcription regulator
MTVVSGLESKINTAKDFLDKLGKVENSDSLKSLLNNYFSNSTSQETALSDIPYAIARVIEAYADLKPEERTVKLKVIDNLNKLYLDVIKARKFPGDISAEDVAALANEAYIVSRKEALKKLANEELETLKALAKEKLETLTALATEDLMRGNALSAIEKFGDAYKSSNPKREQSANDLKAAVIDFEKDGEIGIFIKKYCLAGGNVIDYFSQEKNKEILQKLRKESGDNVVEACLHDNQLVNGKATQYWTIQHGLADQLYEHLEQRC